MSDREWVRPPLTEQQLSQSIEALGFQPNASLVEVLQTVGNGGFGPGYGLMGLAGGAADDTGKNAVELYGTFRQTDADDPLWVWPEKVLPICHWGCAIYSCVDCTSDSGGMVTWDPNQLENDGSAQEGLFPLGISFEQWIKDWGEGVDLSSKIYPDG